MTNTGLTHWVCKYMNFHFFLLPSTLDQASSCPRPWYGVLSLLSPGEGWVAQHRSVPVTVALPPLFLCPCPRALFNGLRSSPPLRCEVPGLGDRDKVTSIQYLGQIASSRNIWIVPLGAVPNCWANNQEAQSEPHIPPGWVRLLPQGPNPVGWTRSPV